MYHHHDIKRPSKEVQIAATKSYNKLAATLTSLKLKNPEIEIEPSKEKIRIPLDALKIFVKILEAMSQGTPISIVPMATEMTTQAAAEFIGCSRPHLIKLLETGDIPFTKIGRHRRVKFEDIVKYKNEMKRKQELAIIKMMKSDEETGLYDS